MTDIVERLRDMADDMLGPYRRLTLEAADEIERLREENDIMRRHLNLHPDKPLGNELRAENERLRLRVKFLEDELKCPAALEPKP